MQPRWAMSFLRGPMTGSEVRRARGGVEVADWESRDIASEPMSVQINSQ